MTILVGVALAKWIAPPIGTAASAFGIIIDNATKLQPFWMGIAVSVLVGVALTLPISSAAICSVLGLTGLAGGAAVAGCCAQMVGFAVMSFKENRWGGHCFAGPRHVDAPDAEHCQKSPRLDRADARLRHHRPHRHVRVPS